MNHCALPAHVVNDMHPLSSVQQDIWLGQLFAPDQPSYNIGCIMVFDGTLQRDVWEQAITAMIARHEALRMVLVEASPLPGQRVLQTLPFSLPWHDYSASADSEQCAREHIQQAIAKPFELYGKPLWEIQWIQVSATRGYCMYLCHHIAMDGVSLSMLSQQVIEIYNQLLRHEPDQSVAPSFLQAVYADQAYIDSSRYQRDLAYWRERLRARPEPLYPSPSGALGRQPIVQLSDVLDPAVFLALSALAERQGGSFTSLIAACVATCLARLNNHPVPVAIGLTVHNRHNAAERAMLGMLSTQLPLYLSVQPHADLATAMRHLATEMRPAMRHARCPPQHALRHLGEAGQQVPRPFDISVSVEDFSAVCDFPIEGGTRLMKPIHGDYEDAALGIVVWRYNTARPITLLFNVDTDRVPLALAERALASLRQMLLALLEAPQTPLCQLPLVPSTERAQLDSFNGREVALAGPAFLQQHFEHHAQRTPHATALVDGDMEVRYAELDARANPLAHHLSAMGVGPDVRVAVCLPRGIDLVVALLAVLKAGGTYVPLDPVYPPERLAYMLHDSAPRCMLTHTSLAAWVTDSALARVYLDQADAWAMQPKHSPDPVALGLSPQHLAYVIYTSGSTGQPKGVMVSHHALMHFLSALQRQLPLTPKDRLLAVTTICFDIAGLELFAPLTQGACVVMAGGPSIQDPPYWRALVDQHAISVLQATPAFWQMLLDAGWHSRPHLRLLCGGEALSHDLAQRLIAGGGQLCNLYGPTEATIWASLYPVLGTEAGSVVPLGRPLANHRMRLLDTYQRLVPLGVTGELCIAGPQLARGYLDRADLTAERFVPDPFAEQPGQRMYKTGDLARWRADGVLEYLGRNDDQVKIRGFRIELGEIETALRACEGVREAVVVAREDRPGDKRLVAYLVSDAAPVNDTGVLSADRLRSQLARSLPEYMLPAAYVRLDALPLTANGKVDRRALPAPDQADLGHAAHVAPQGPLEQTLAQVWSDLLGIGQIGRHDSFFALGGHSLLAVRLLSRIRSDLGLELSLAALFAQPRLADLAHALEHAAASTLPSIVPTDRSAPLPLSFAQQRLWFLAQLDAQADRAYLMPNGLRLRGRLDRVALRQALDRIVARHETLRTRIALHQEQPVQVIDQDNLSFALSEHDLSGHADPEAQARHYAELQTQTPFDLANDTFARGQLLRLGDDDHVLLVTLHHLVSDGWSMGLLVHELGTLYAAFTQGRPDPLPPLALQYADIAAWQRRWITGELLQRQREFWVDHLQGAPTLLELATDRPRPALQDYRGDAVRFALDAELTSALKALGQCHGSTLFMTLLATWSVLLSRLSGQDKIVIGSPVANRQRSESEPLIGFFANTQALCVDLSANPSVAALLAQVRATTLAAQDHQDLPFEQLIEAINPVRSLSHHPLFQVMLTLDNQPPNDLHWPQLQATVAEQSTATIKFDLQLALQEADGRIVGSLCYAAALFERSTVERHLAQLMTLLHGMRADDTVPVAQLPLLTPAQRDQVLYAFNACPGQAPDDEQVYRAFERHAALTPDAIALVFEDATLSYAQLDAQANRLAHHLTALGVVTDDRVAVCLQRGISMVVAVLATLKTGAAYVPVDPAYPPERQTYMLRDCQALVLLTSPDCAQALSVPDDLTVVCADAAQPVWQDLPATAPQVAGTAMQGAYVIYTSGSTGRPKGVVMPHGPLLNLLQWEFEQSTQAGLQALRTLQFSALGFDASFQEIFSTLSTGATLVLMADAQRRDMHALYRTICTQRIERLYMPYIALQSLAETVQADPALAALECNLKQVLTAGEQLRITPAIRAFFAARPACRLHNYYGPTETHVASVHPLPLATDQWPLLPPIGAALPRTPLYVLDAYAQPLPIGATGELYIAGVQVARGYLHRPALTAERFLPDPFAMTPGQRMYRTGDLARWRADGSVDFLGRNDDQVKLRGYRIEPGEIEAALQACPGVREAAVLLREDRPGDKRLVAYLVGQDLNLEQLRDLLDARLPDYMVPTAYVVLPALPITTHGKLDRRALPTPDASALAVQTYEAPQGEREVLLAALWSELLGLERIGRHDNFFALGGHSLMAVQLLTRLRARQGLELPLATLFAHPRLADFALQVANAPRTTFPALVAQTRPDPLPLSFAQQRLWFLAQLDAQADLAYLMPGGVDLHGQLHLPALQQALDRIVARHEALRTRFVAHDHGTTQVIAPAEVGFALECIDLRHAADAHAQAQHYAELETQTAFDLSRGPLIRGRLLRLAEEKHRLLVTMHHIVADGWSIGIVFHEVGVLYSAFARGQPDPLPPLAIQYPDYTLWQRRWIDGPLLQRQRAFWVEHLHEAPALLELPTDRPRPALQNYTGDSVAVALSAELTSALVALSQRHGTTVFMTMLAAWGVLLARLSGQDQVVIGTPVANRTHAEVEPLIGLFVNTQALCIDLRGNPSLAQFLAQVRATVLAAQDHQDLPFEQLIEALNPVRSLAYHPVFQVMFTWQNTPQVTLALADLRSEVLLGPAHDAKYDLDLDLRQEGPCIVGSLRFATALFDHGTIQRQLDSLVVLLNAMVHDEHRPVARLPLLSQIQQPLEGFNPAEALGPQRPCVHQWFAQQAAATPHAIALLHGEQELRYADLDAHANQLAHRLIHRGVRPNDCVALCLERGIAQIVAVLAVLKAGAAYLPLEPKQPVERLAALVHEARPALIIVRDADSTGLFAHNAVGAPVIGIATEQAAAAACPDHAPVRPNLHVQQLAYVIYTSGSSGRPKGVMVSHHALATRLHALIDTYGFGPQDRILQFSTLAFDASVEEIFGALCSGATLVLRSDAWLDIDTFWQQCGQAGITVVDLPTRFWAQLCAPSLEIPEAVRQVIIGGEALTAAMQRSWGPRRRPRLLNTYGPTEATVVATVQAVEHDTPAGIGRPLASTQAHVLDRHAQPLPIGTRGELHVAGSALAHGYLGRPDLTAERFIPDPFAATPGQRMYKTGDLASWRADGCLAFHGRNDRQIKLRGFRIEPGEIEALLRRCDAVEDALVVARANANDQPQLVAYLVTAQPEHIDPLTLRRSLAQRLPDYMVPAAYVTLQAWPLTPSGKLDQAALPSPDGSASQAQEYSAPEGELETVLATQWSQLLGVERISRNDDFFNLGGHSLLAVQLVSRLRTQLGLEIALATVFAQPRLANLAAALAHAQQCNLPAIVPAARPDPLPLSFAQQRLWFLAQLDAQADLAYLMPGGVDLHGQLHLPALQQALDRIVARHEALRTRFVAHDDGTTQVIAPAGVGFALECIDLRNAADAHAQAQRYAELETHTAFDLTRGPLIRGRLLRLADEEHRLLVTMHHIVADGWSIKVMLQELAALYAAFVQAQPDPLPPLPIQYADYTLWQRRWLQGPVLQRQLDFWRHQLHDAHALLNLPTDRPRPALQDYRGATVDVVLDAELTAALRTLSQRHGATVFMTLLAAWGVLLARLSGQDHVIVGTPVANRNRSELEGLIGFFVNTQALPVDLRANPSVAELLAQVRATALAAQDHQDAPFEHVIEALSPARSLSHHPLFQAMLVWQNPSETELVLPALRLCQVDSPERDAKFDLDLSLRERSDGIVGSLCYATALFDRSTIERHVAQFMTLLRGMVANDATRVARLPLLSANERDRWLDTLAARQIAFADDHCLHTLFEQHVARTPNAIALVEGGLELGYADLDARANQIAHHLIALGIGPEDRVALYLERSIDLVVALLAVLKAGAAYLPMDPAYPAERLRFMLDDAQPRLLLAHRALADTLASDAGIAIVLLDGDTAAWAHQPTHRPARAELLPQHPAYVIYTSGSTGTPKGVVIAHAQVVRLLHATAAWVAPCAEDVWTLFHSCAFDFSVWELWGALAYGARLVVVSQDTARDPRAFQALLCQQRVSVLNQTPSAFQALVDAQRHEPHPHALRLVIFGGEALQPASLAPWFAQHGQRTALLNMYGITETTVHVTAHALTAQDVERPGHSPVGAPLSDLRAYVLAADGQCLPIGVAGELYVAGAGLARGYLARPGLTAERFIPDPFAQQPGQRMYKTGDLARWRADGTLDYLGRNDDQVKIRGFRIELGEIQAALHACDGVREAVVVSRNDAGNISLIAYVVGEPTAIAPDILRSQLAARLPEYMLPAAYVALEALPLTANGKLDRRALPAPDAGALVVQAYAAPQGELEIGLAALWRELLGVEQVGRHDSFFALGGHSLLGVRLISRIRSELGLELPLAALFAQPRLAELALALGNAGTTALPPILPLPRSAPLPLSFAQQRLWFVEQLDPRAARAYLIGGGVDLLGALNLPALRQALDRILARHEALRTCFVDHDDGATQVIAPPEVGFALECIDLRHATDAHAQAQHDSELEAQTAFDLTRGPLIRGRLLRLADEEHRLLVTMHHIVSDGWSMGLLVNELSTLYAAFAQGQPDPLPPLPIQYADYTLWQRRWLQGPVLQRQLDFWREHLHGAPALLELPTDRPRPPLQDYSGESVEFALDAELTSTLVALSQRHGTTVFMTVLAAWGVLLARLSGQDQAVIGTPVANRTRSELEPLIGFFVNTQALRVDLRERPSVAALLAQVRATALTAQDHQDLPFEHLIEALNPERSLSHHPVFQAMLTWQNNAAGALRLPGIRLQPIPTDRHDAKFDLELFMGQSEDRILGRLAYATALFDRSTIERQLAQFVQVLAAMAAEDRAAVHRLPLLPVEQRAQLQGFTSTDAAPIPARCIHHLFEDQVRRTPDAIALLEGEVQLSYAVLEARANHLAHRLHASGVGLESRVALYLPRGIDQVVALLATLKAGAAYLPLDPELPSERLTFLLEDSRPRAVLTCEALQDTLQASCAMLHVRVLTLDLDANLDRRDPGPPSVQDLCPDHLAYIIYTSGSTGQPKGTLLTHAGAAHYLQWAVHTYRPFPSAVVSSSLAFDATLTSLLAPLLCGARVELLPEYDTLDALRQRLCDATPLGLVKLTPAHLEVLGQQLADHPQPLSAKVMVIGGEALSSATLARWQTLAPHTRLINEYGPTETVVGCVVHEATAEDAHTAHGRVPIGRPIDQLRLYVLDPHGQLAPIGVAGHLHIAGPQLARGYLARPDLTADRFVPDPFAEQPGQRMYRSGDLACWRADGTLDYLGRNDDQVKLRGHRIELGDIAAALRACNGVQDAAVLLREDTPGERRLVAYLVGGAEHLAAEALRAQLATRLPEVMLPTAYVPLDALPLTPNGKLDRKAFPSPDASAYATNAHETPQGPVEEAIAAIWRDLLGLETIGRRDDFFALGGHSLLAVQVVSRLRTQLGVEIGLATLFAQPRLANLAAALAHAQQCNLPAIVPAARPDPLPLSFAQQRLWFLAQLDAQADLAYLMSGGVDLHGQLHLPALQQALDRIVARHEALRTRFVAHDDGTTQVIAPAGVGFALECIDLRNAADAHAQAQRYAELETHTAFDLTRGPLIRGRLLRLADEEHRLLVTMHHIVADGWSIKVMLQELAALYAAFVQAQPDPLPPLPIQYADYTLWQRRWLQGPVLQRQLDFWRHQLHDAHALLNLPTDRPRPALQDYRGATVDVVLDAELTAALRTLSQRHGATVFMTLLAAWGVLLARLSGQDHVIVGTPVANRNRSELEGLIGFFVNTQALPVDLRANPSVAELLAQVRATALAAQDHQDAPFEHVIEALSPARSLSHHPLFQAMLVWQNPSETELVLPALRLCQVDSPERDAKFDLDLSLRERSDGIVGSLCYATALFDRSTIERHVAQFMTLLRGMVANDATRVARLPLLSANERDRWLDTLAARQIAFADDHCLHTLFEQHVARTPNAIALVEGGLELGYADLDARANQIAHHLIALGIGPEDRVALYLERSIDLVVALLAVLKAGAAYLPMDPAYPAERLRFMLDDAQPRLLLAHRALADTLASDAGIAIVLLDGDTAAWAHQPTHRPARAELLPQHPAYVIYTSGSTGTPKGVVIAHAQVVRLLHATAAWVAPCAEDVWTLFHSCAFDFSVWELWGALAYGARLVVVSQDTARDPRAFQALLCQQRVSVLNQTPSAFQALVDAQRHEPHPHALRLVIFGGEALQPASLAPWFAQHGQRTALLNMYGITETTVHVTAHALTAQDVERPGHSPVGAPLSDLRAYVLAADGQCLPIGVAGELYVAGAGLARGYLARPGLTAERFIPDPFAQQPGQRMYKTGDLARWRADGTLDYLGRNDDQVKIRGFRIELGEIQAALHACDGVREAVVVSRNDAGNISLIAYVVGEPTAIAPDILRSQLAARLPEYMLPAAYVALEALPLTANGKLDRRALPAPDQAALGHAAHVAPQGPLEQTLAQVWSDLLGIEQIGRHDSFFALGGHSLLAIKMIERLRLHGWQLEVRALFGNPTLIGLAETLKAASTVTVPPNLIDADCTHITPDLLPLIQLTQTEIDAVVATVQGGAANLKDIYPLTALQEGLLFHHLADPLADPYLNASLIIFPSRSKRDAFIGALEQVIARHDILRTGFAWEGLDSPVQVVWRHATLSQRLHVLEGADPGSQLLAWMHSPEAAPSLQHAPLMHAHIANDAVAGRWLLGLQHHHLVMDRITLELMIEEVKAHMAGQQHHLPDPLPFRDFIANAHAGASTQEHQAFFTEMLGDIGAPTAPFGMFAPVHDQASFHEAHQPLPAALARSLRHQARRCGVGASSLFHLAYALLLARTSGQEDVVFATMLLGRMHASSGVDRVLGMFLNALPIRLGGDHPTVLHAVRHTQLCMGRLLDHEHAPLAMAQRCSGLDPAVPLLSALLNYRHISGSSVLAEDVLPLDDALHDVQEIQGQERTHYPLVVSVNDHTQNGGFSLDVQCVRQISVERVMAMMLQAVQAVVHALEHAPDRPLHALDLLPEHQRTQLLQQFNQSSAPWPGSALLQPLFDAQCRQTPDAPALSDAHVQLSYAQLDVRANRLAHRLIAAGVRPETRVALYLGRGAERLVALLAVLKAGGAYVPLDPDHPIERLAFMLADARPRVILTDSQLQEQLPASRAMQQTHVIVLDAPVPSANPAHDHAPMVSGLDPDHLAYVIYTSGSTGKPKGVMVSHRGLVNLAQAQIAAFDVTPDSRVLQMANIGFDACLSEVLMAWLAGARLHVPPSEAVAGEPLLEVMHQQRITHLTLTPAVLGSLPAQVHCPSLQTLVLAGEAAEADLVQRWQAHTRVINAYGPTEASVCASLHLDGARPGEPMPIGRPMANVRLYVLDTRGRSVPIGVSGELHIAGQSLARGYLGRAGLTAERFVPDPFADQPGQRMYKTGDLASWRADGSLDYLGRNDHQVKLRGMRLELGEIEACLRSCAGVRQAVVLVREDIPGDKRLVAYVLGDVLGQAPDNETLHAHLAAQLPDYMRPMAYVYLDALPLTANGKLDRRALPTPDAHALAAHAYVAPEGQLEILLAALWSELLGIEQIGRHDSFFALGGHSLLAVRLSAAIRRTLHCDVPIQGLFAQPTLQQMSHLILTIRLEQLQAAEAAHFLSEAKLER
ncbi:non-ribosomal peptide synthetase [Xanthomonas oryzae]|uniref:Non-ribosomal peptide synthetase n=4 Tax=Xanthomonas oryzae TaxID=347 RepID=L0HRU3_9XANT|nr:non-ribosomal peptide synthetase [Xanthomonas oryzae]AGB08525.1 non-ribosomal peptide synthetase [Xanthomonas oryzae]AVT99226.1 non-ribosomal peptide synthetase [Xanthomonas oryzae pv. oryzae]AVU02884.1 non-ribosomal peptide synthetase [Xanthomonas oryzae pv. oryzae]QBN28516.1 non-ribosomal peptide synthetase [Xanthomonas oryzae pv. oryzae]QBN32417.1 non-ribosomal peptide synthetase [Xanthomonas oryzae pv. oryzae]